MDQLQQKALNALEPYIALSKSATWPRAATSLIMQATSAPNTYVFAELLQTPNIQALRTAPSESAVYLHLLEIFAWGTWQDYEARSDLPRLVEAQQQKLRQLSLLSLAGSHVSVTYLALMAALSLPNAAALEQLVISAIYASLISARLDPLAARVEIWALAPLRDLRPQSVPGLVDLLSEWDARCATVLADLEARVRRVHDDARTRAASQRQHELNLARALGDPTSAAAARKAGKRGVDGEAKIPSGTATTPGFPASDDAMDLDDSQQDARERAGAAGAGRNKRAAAGTGRRLGP